MQSTEQLRQGAMVAVRAALKQDAVVALRAEEKEAEILEADEVVADIFFSKISKWTLYDLVKKKKIPFFYIGKRIFFRRSSLIAWIAEQEAESMQLWDGILFYGFYCRQHCLVSLQWQLHQSYSISQ